MKTLRIKWNKICNMNPKYIEKVDLINDETGNWLIIKFNTKRR